MSSLSSRERILQSLRASRRPFEDAPARPVPYLPVTAVPDTDLITRFKTEVERLTGQCHVPTDPQHAIDTVLAIVGADSEILTWGNLPLPGLTEALENRHIRQIVPHASDLAGAASVRVGITGVDAAFATTGTLVLATTGQQGRLPSLLPTVHIALLPRERLYARLEDWIAANARAHLAESNSIVLITGPSRTGDIEMSIILGVHGPKVVHVVIV